MPVSGLVVTLSRSAGQRVRTLELLRAHHGCEVGEPQGHRVPLIVDSADTEQDRSVWEWLWNLEGVEFVDVVCIHDLEPPKPDSPTSHGVVAMADASARITRP